MEEQRVDSEFVGDCREPMEEKVAGKGLALSSKTETLDGEDAETVAVLVGSGVCGTDNVEKIVCSDDNEVKLVDERVGSEICDDVERVSLVVKVETNDETTKSEAKSTSGEIAGQKEIIISGGNEVTNEKANCEVVDKSGACDGEMNSVVEEKKLVKNREENVALTKHSESAPFPEESTKGNGNKRNPEVNSAGGICSKEENGEAIDCTAEEEVEKDVKVGGVLENVVNESEEAGNNLQVSMKRGANMKPIPIDLIIEIFSRLPAKSIGRFRSLSKQWCSILSSRDFIKLTSRACPHLLFAVERKGVWRFFSSPQSWSSHVVAAEFHSRFSEDIGRFTCSYASGLFYFLDMFNPRVGQSYVVCNPLTGQYVTLPEVDMDRHARGFLGFDPIEKKFKVLAEGHPSSSHRNHHVVLTLGTGELSYRKMTDSPKYWHSLCAGICINGIIYYLISKEPISVVSFDVRSETFTTIVAECFVDPETTKLINHKGKLGGIECSYGEANGRYTLELRLCVLEDVERHEWSTYMYTLPENKLIDDLSTVSVAGMTDASEIVLAMDYTCKPYYVFYFNPEKNTLKSVEIQGFGAELEAVVLRGRVSAFVDHVEHLDLEDFKNCGFKFCCSSCDIEHVVNNDPKELRSVIFSSQACSNCEEEQEMTETQ